MTMRYTKATSIAMRILKRKSAEGGGRGGRSRRGDIVMGRNALVWRTAS